MLRKMLLSASIVGALCGFARAAAQDEISSALQKLADSPNYSWKTTVTGGFGAGETTGKTQKDGLILLSITRQDATYEAVIQGDKAVAKVDDAWKTTAELAATDAGGGGGPSPERMLAGTIQSYKTPVALAQESAGKLQNVQKTDDAYTGDLSEEAAKAALTFRRRPGANANAAAPTITNPKASIKVWVKDGTVTKMESHITGTVSFNGNDRDIDRTSTTEFSAVGSTVITVPDAAKAKLAAAPATQP